MDALSVLLSLGTKAVSVSIDTSGEPNRPPGFEPNGAAGWDWKILPPVVLLGATEPNPPLLAKLANPEDAGEVEAPLPNTFPGVAPTLANPDFPNAGVAAAAPGVAETHGEALTPKPRDDD